MDAEHLKHIQAEVEAYSPVSITEGLPDGVAQAIIFANLMKIYGRQLLADLALLNRAYDLACAELEYWKCWRDHFLGIAEKEANTIG